MPNYAPRISLPFNDVSGVIHMWASSCLQMAVFQHDSDEKVNTTHVHMIMLGCKYKTCETLKDQFYKITGRKDLSGNSLWEWTHTEWKGDPDIGFITYMSKGELRPVYVKDITDEKVEELRKKWVSHPKGVESSLVQSRIKTKDPKKLTKYDIVVEVAALVKDKNPTTDFEDIPDEVWFNAISKILIANKQVLGQYKMMDLYDGCLMYYAKNKLIANLLAAVEKRKPRI